MQRYLQIGQQYPHLRPAGERNQDFAEIYDNFEPQKAEDQSSRCLQCGVPFCQVACPLHNHIPDWLRLTAEGRLREAYDMASLTNTFPEICGRICPQDRLCEGSCVVEQASFNTITIGSVEKYITETAFEHGWVEPFAPVAENGLSVGIIGAGPAGLAAAEQLRRAGYAVHVYDRHDRVGGLLVYGIPNFKLDKAVVERRREQYEASGVVFHCGVEIGHSSPLEGEQVSEANRGGADVGELSPHGSASACGLASPAPPQGGSYVSLDELRSRHDAVLIATGVYKARALEAAGSDRHGVIPALDFLIASNKTGLGDAVERFASGELDAKGKKVVVVGGGDTAMDCVRTAVRQGAKRVVCLYRRDRENMPGSRREVGYAEEEGVTFEWLSLPAAFRGRDRVEEVRITPMRLGPADASGRRAALPVEDGEYGMDADMVIAALGFEPEALPLLFDAPELTVTSRGTLEIDRQMMTSLPGVFAAGDIVRGASLVVWAIADGREAAVRMMEYMNAQQVVAA